MKTLHLFILCLLSAATGYSQYTDSLLCKFNGNTHTFNTNLSDGDDLYLTFQNHNSKRVSIWLYNDVNPKGKQLTWSKGSLTQEHGLERQNPHIFKKGAFVYVIIGGHDYEYSVITKIKQGVVQSKDSVRLNMSSFLPGKSLLYFAGRNSSLGQVWASYNLATGEKSYVASPTKVYLKGVVVDTAVFTLQDSTQLYAGYKGQAATRVFKAGYAPSQFVDFGNRSYFRYENSFYSTDGSKRGTQLIRTFGPNERLTGVGLSARGVLLSLSLSSFHTRTLLYEPDSSRLRYIATSKTSFAKPMHFAEDRYLFAGQDFYYMDQRKQDSGFFKQTFHYTFAMFYKTDYEHSKHYFSINNMADTFNFYMVDTSLTIQRLNTTPLVSYKGTDSAFHIASPLFTHKDELYYAKYTSNHVEIRRFTLRAPVGMAEMRHEVKLYPNPANDRVTLQSTSPIKSISVFDSQGQLCFSKQGGNNTSHTLNVSEFPAGLYFVRFYSQGLSHSTGFIKK